MVNCYNYFLQLNTKIKSNPVFYRNNEGLWTLQASVLMYSWECEEAAFNAKEHRLEIIIAATKSNLTGKHTCHDLIVNLCDANCGVQYTNTAICITIIDDKPYIVGEKVGSFKILEEILSNVSLQEKSQENTAILITTPLKNVFWKFDYEKLPSANYEEEVAQRDITEKEARLLLADTIDKLSLVLETSAVTTNYINMDLYNPCVATKAFLGTSLTVAGTAIEDLSDPAAVPIAVAHSFGVTDYRRSVTGGDAAATYGSNDYAVSGTSWTVGYVGVRPGLSYSPGFSYSRADLATIDEILAIMLGPGVATEDKVTQKNPVQGGVDCSVTGVVPVGLYFVSFTDISSHDAEEWVDNVKTSTIYVAQNTGY